MNQHKFDWQPTVVWFTLVGKLVFFRMTSLFFELPRFPWDNLEFPQLIWLHPTRPLMPDLLVPFQDGEEQAMPVPPLPMS
ncbi:hypothetical protein HUJ05_005831 [Dendroctonus ponderosae]|nr:hypothetical protein HUJ05_005831 [Dendroctonus ponderosae]